MSTTPIDDSQLLGAVILARHGDREGFYQDPKNYSPADTSITPLGSISSILTPFHPDLVVSLLNTPDPNLPQLQEYLLGQFLRSVYLDPSSPSHIQGVNSLVADDAQIKIRADAGGERGVIFNSAVSMLQGLFPPTEQYNVTLANGTVVVGPLGGYQTVPIESVESDQDVSLEGWVACGAFTENTQAFYHSAEFAQKKAESAAFLSELEPYLGGRPASLENMWNIFDYLNVQSIHNASFAPSLPPTFLAQARDLANWQQANIFSSPRDINGIGNIPGRTMVSSILNGMASITDPSDSMKILYQGISYKPFISLFRMTGAIDMNPRLAGIVNYAAAISFEVRSSSSNAEPTVRLLFKNGTDETSFTRIPILGSTDADVSLSKLIDTLAPTAVNTTEAWCSVCGNSEDRGCGALALARTQGMNTVRHRAIGSVGAGFLGAGLAMAVSLMAFGVLLFLGILTFKRKGSSREVVDLGDKVAFGYDTESQREAKV